MTTGEDPVSDDVAVRDHPAAGRYELCVGGAIIGVADYRQSGKVVSFTHVEVDPRYRGRGLAARLVTAALDATRTAGLRARPLCPYVVAFVASRPEYQDLLADD